MNAPELITERLIDFVYGELSQPDAAEVRRLIDSDPAWRAEHDRLRAVLTDLDQLPDQPVPAELLSNIRDEINRAAERETLLSAAAPRRRSFLPVLAAAAVLVIAATLLFVFISHQPPALAGNVQVIPQSLTLTVFNDNLALVRDHRLILNLPRGVSPVRFTDVAPLILPDSVRFLSLSNPAGTAVLEQNYEYDLASPDALLAKFIDKPVTCLFRDGSILEGTLLSFSSGAAQLLPTGGANEAPGIGPQTILRTVQAEFQSVGQNVSYNNGHVGWAGQDGQVIIDAEGNDTGPLLQSWAQYDRDAPVSQSPPAQLVLRRPDGSVVNVNRELLSSIRFSEPPRDLLTRPTLLWNLRAETPGRNDMELAYLTEGMSWRADYTLVLAPDDTLSFSGWVTINNQSGLSYPDADLKLMAGDVHRVVSELRLGFDDFAHGRTESPDLKDPSFIEKSFAEYHLYTLQGKTILKDNQTKQIQLLSADGIKFTRDYIFDTAWSTDLVAVQLRFKNEKTNHLGMPLPKGLVRIQAPDSQGELEQVSQDEIEHTPKDEELKLRAGYAFDVAAEHTQTSFRRVGRTQIATYAVTLRNHKSTPVEITLRDHFGGDWRVTQQSDASAKPDSTTIEFRVKLEPNSQKSVQYTIQTRN